MEELLVPEEKKEIRFSPAGIFFLLFAVISLVQLAMSAAHGIPVRSLLLPVLADLALIFAGILLLMRKHNGLLLAGLSAMYALKILNEGSSLLFWLHYRGDKIQLLASVIMILADLFFLIYSIAMLPGEKGKLAGGLRKIWFLAPVLLLLAYVLLCFLSTSGITVLFRILDVVPQFLLAAWLANPYRAGASAPVPVQQSIPVQSPSLEFCPSCGARVEAGAAFCTSCGSRLAQTSQPVSAAPAAVPGDAPSGGYAAIGFFIPLAGLILYLVQKDAAPLRAKSAGKGALAGVITWTALTILLCAVYFIWITSLFH